MMPPSNCSPSDDELLAWISAGPEQQQAGALVLRRDAEFVSALHRAIRVSLKKAIYGGTAFSLDDATQSVWALVLEHVLSPAGLAKTLLRRGAEGRSFDPRLGTLRSWLIGQAYWQVRGWLKKWRRQESLSPQADSNVDQLPAPAHVITVADAQEQSRATQRRLRQRLESLVDRRRAVMLVRYLHFADEQVLRREEFACLWRVRQGQSSSAAADMGPYEEQILRAELRALSDGLTGSRAPSSAVPRSDDGVPAHAPPSDVDKIRRLDQAFATWRQAERFVACFRRELLNERWTLTAIAELETQAESMKTLAAVQDRFAQESRAVLQFALWSHRLTTACRQLEQSRDMAAQVEAVVTPKPKAIAEFLRLSAKEVTEALGHARREIGRSGTDDFLVARDEEEEMR